MRWLRAALGQGNAASAPAPQPAAPTDDPPEWKKLGNRALGQGDLTEAARCYTEGVLAAPRDASLRLNLGYVLLEQGDAAAAADRLLQAIALRAATDDFLHEAQFFLGRAHAALGQPDQALAHFEAALRARPDFVQPVEEAVRLCHQLGRHAQAVDWARRLLTLQASPPARQILAAALVESGQYQEAADLLEQALAENPEDLESGLLRLRPLLKLGRFEDAVRLGEHLLECAGPSAGVLVNLAMALEKTNRLDAALERAEQALQLEPAHPDAHYNRVVVLMAQGKVDAAIAAARSALALLPQHADLHWYLSFALLLRGELREGWAEHEWRIRSRSYTGWAARPADVRWQGESLRGKTILLHGEQGFGDSIQFARYVLQLHEARQVLLAVPGELGPLLRQLAPNCRILPPGSQLPEFDVHCPLMSLPFVLGTTLDSIPAPVPYLHADPAAVRTWRERLAGEGLKVGIAWSGRATHPNDRNRSATLAAVRALEMPGCRFFTIQPQLREADRARLADWPQLVDAGSGLRDFADTAALFEALDLVISVDTSVVHLAGALGRPLWVLVTDPPEWRWLEHGQRSPWYPTARLYRQPAAGDWSSVLERVKSDLAALAAARRPASA